MYNDLQILVVRVVTANRDRLVRFGYEWFEKFCQDHGTTLTVMNAETLSPEFDYTQETGRMIHNQSYVVLGSRQVR